MAGLGLELYLSSDIEDNPDPPATEDPPFAEDPTTDSENPTEDPATGIMPEDPGTEDSAAFRVTLPLPPLDRRYNTPEEGIESINQLGLDHGYAVVKRRSKKTKGQVPKLKKVQLQCDRGDVYALPNPPEQPDPPEQPEQAPAADSAPSKKRKTHTLAIDYPFDISLRL